MSVDLTSARPLVLVVDDEPRVRKAISAGLAAGGFRVIEAGSGREALKILESRTPDIVLVDLVMPSMGGIDFMREMRTHPAWYKIPVVVLSGRTATNARVAALSRGAVDVVAKPYSVRELNARLHAHLDKGPVPDRVDATEVELPRSSAERALRSARWSRWRLVLSMSVVAVAVLAAAYGVAGVAGAVVAAIVVAVVCGACYTDASGGLVVGLVGAAAADLVLVRTGLVTDIAGRHRAYPVLAAAVVLLIFAGAAVGMVSERRRRRRRQREIRTSAAKRSIGMLSPEAGAARLEEEIARAEFYGRPLAIARISLLVRDDSLGEDDVMRLRRAVARTIETALHLTDVPYATSDTDFAIIMPEVSATAAADLLGPAITAAGHTTFAARGAGRRLSVGQVAEVVVSIDDAPMSGDY